MRILSPSRIDHNHLYRTQVQSLATFVSNYLTDSVTNSCLVDLIDVTLECEDINSKLVDVVTVADVDDEEQFVADLGAEVWS